MQRFTFLVACVAALAFAPTAHAQRQDTTIKTGSQSTTVKHSRHSTETSTTEREEHEQALASKAHYHPKGAAAKCTDGTYSMSSDAAGTCSGHGGVKKWYARARCTDGTLWMHKSKRGACSSHQGVAEWLQKGKTKK